MTNEQLGKEGEQKIVDIVKEIEMELGIKVKTFGPVILFYYSIYGRVSCEIDHIFILNDLIILGETKNGKYKSLQYKNHVWNHLNGEITDNPIYQNNYHKNVFCSTFKICREKVITLELLLQYKSLQLKTQFVNDYVLGIDTIKDYLTLLFNYYNCHVENKEMVAICDKLKNYQYAYGSKINDHLKNLNRIKQIEEKTRTKDGYYRFKRTDSAKCEICNSYLSFDAGLELKRENQRRTFEISLKCKNGHRILPRKDTRIGQTYGFSSVKVISLEKREGWGMEKQRTTIIDDFESLKKENLILKEQNKKILSNMKTFRKKVDEDIESLQETNLAMSNEIKQAEKEIGQYKHIIGKLYYKKNKE